MKYTISVNPKPGDIFEYTQSFREANKSADGWADQRFVIVMTETGLTMIPTTSDPLRLESPKPDQTGVFFTLIYARQLRKSLKSEAYTYDAAMPLQSFIEERVTQYMVKVGHMEIPNKLKVQTARTQGHNSAP